MIKNLINYFLSVSIQDGALIATLMIIVSLVVLILLILGVISVVSFIKSKLH